MPSPKRAQRKRAPSPSRKRPRLRLKSCARGEVSWRTLVDRFESEQRSLHDALSRRDAKILDLEAEIAAEKRYSDRLRQERKDSPPLSMGTASVTAAIEICHIHFKLSPSLSIRRSEVSIVIDSAVIHTSASLASPSSTSSHRRRTCGPRWNHGSTPPNRSRRSGNRSRTKRQPSP